MTEVIVHIDELKDELAQVVPGLHEAIVDEDTFSKVQYILIGRSRQKNKPSKLNELYSLRGHLSCPQCGGNLTGSASTSKTGDKQTEKVKIHNTKKHYLMNAQKYFNQLGT